MVMDSKGRLHEPQGIPTGGQYAKGSTGHGMTDDLPLNPMLARATQGLRAGALKEHVEAKSAEETRGLLDMAAGAEVTADGIVLYDGDGQVVFRQTDGTPHLDYKVLRRDPKCRAAVRRTLKSDLKDMSAADRRKTVQAAWRMASPYDRRMAIEKSPVRRYIPASSIANSLRHRKDRDKAVGLLVALHYEDASASANVIRSGYPNDRDSAFAFINKTKIQRDRNGRAIVGDYTDRDGNPKHGPLPADKGAAARSYLRMLYQPTRGVPDKEDTRRITNTLKELGDYGADVQAQAFWELCYGNGSMGNPRGDLDYCKTLVGQEPGKARGVRLLDRLSRGRGQGNAARMAAYQKCLTHEAAVRFCAMEPGDQRKANTMFTRRRRNKDTGLMEDVKPRRLTEMRSWIRAVYRIDDSEVRDMRASMDAENAPRAE